MGVEIAQSRWLRSRARTTGIGATWLLYAASFVWMAFHHHERASNGTEYTSVTLTVFILVLALPGLVLGIRQLRAGLWMDSQIVIFRGMFRTVRLGPDEVDGFKAENRLAPSPVLYRKHGLPVVVGSLARGGWLRARDANNLEVEEAFCEQLNALLLSVQSDQPARPPAELGLRPADRQAGYARLKQIQIAITVAVVIVCVAVAALLQTVAAVALVTVIAAGQIASSCLILRSARHNMANVDGSSLAKR